MKRKNISKLAVIPARGGSKRLKNKNILPLAGKPVVAHTIETAIKSRLFDKILLSTDNEKIARIGKSMGVSIYERPEEFATDTIGVVPALAELISTLESRGENFDIVCQMLPTCLFRKASHLKEAMSMLDKNTESVIGVSAYDFPLKKALRLKGEKMEIYFEDSPWKTGTARTQDQEVFYHDNGSFYIAWWNSFMKNKNFFLGKMKGFVVPPINAFDLDTKEDFIVANLFIEYAKKRGSNNYFKKALSHIFK